MTKEFNWTTSDNLEIYAVDWKVEYPKAVIALVHGLGEHVRRYDHLADFFNQRNIAVVGYDRRGHGRSGGKRGHTKNYAAYLDEIAQLLAETEMRYPNVPTFLYGHSMGGNLALKYTLDRHPIVKGVILTGPWIGLPESAAPSGIMMGAIKMMNFIYPSLVQPSKLDAANVSRDTAVVEKYKNDPLVHDRLSIRTAHDMFAAGDWLNAYKGKMEVPTLIMHGSDDRLTSFDASQAFAKRVSGDVTFRRWDGLYHEIHNEPEQKEVFEFTLDWMRKQL